MRVVQSKMTSQHKRCMTRESSKIPLLSSTRGPAASYTCFRWMSVSRANYYSVPQTLSNHLHKTPCYSKHILSRNICQNYLLLSFLERKEIVSFGRKPSTRKIRTVSAPAICGHEPFQTTYSGRPANIIISRVISSNYCQTTYTTLQIT